METSTASQAISLAIRELENLIAAISLAEESDMGFDALDALVPASIALGHALRARTATMLDEYVGEMRTKALSAAPPSSLNVTCPMCAAPPGEPCWKMSKPGGNGHPTTEKATATHAVRHRAWMEAEPNG